MAFIFEGCQGRRRCTGYSVLIHLPWPLAVAGSVEIVVSLALVGITRRVAPLGLARHNPGRKEVIQGKQ